MPTLSPNISLLWPLDDTPDTPNSPQTRTPLDANTVRDLDLQQTLKALCLDGGDPQDIGRILLNLCADVDIIRYRQDVLRDLLTHRELYQGLLDLLPITQALTRYRRSKMRQQTPLQQVVWRLGELENVVDGITRLAQVFEPLGEALESAGLQALRQAVLKIAADETFQHLQRNLPNMLEKVRGVTSITIGINLDRDLQPVAATILSLNDQEFTGSRFLQKLFGRDTEAYQGIADLHSLPKPDPKQPGLSPRLAPLFRDLADLLKDVAYPIEKSLRQYNKINGGFLASLQQDFMFYLGAVQLIDRLSEQGLPFCCPEIAPMDARVCQVEQNFNLNLAVQFHQESRQSDEDALPLTERIVQNRLILGEQGRIVVLTGPNGGGKTTYLQAIGLTQVLAQAGLYVPGSQARISPVDHLYTHYPTEEDLGKGTGRFGDEAQRINQIFTQSTPHSLLLLNESLASTNAGESLYIAQDILRVLRRMGGRAVFATHLHELAEEASTINASTPGDSKIISMVASRIGDATPAGPKLEVATQRSYTIVPGPPMGRSYARELAMRYGVSYQQLSKTLIERGILSPEETPMPNDKASSADDTDKTTPATAPSPALQDRIDRVSQSFLENASLTDNLNDDAAQVVLHWAMAWGESIARDTAGLNDSQAEEAMYPRLRAARKLFRSVNRWGGDFPNQHPEEQRKHLKRMLAQIDTIYPNSFKQPDAGQVDRFIANPAENTVAAMEALRHFLESRLNNPPDLP